MKNYKITTPHNGCIQYTQTGKDLWCTILDKFNIEYKIEEINSTNSNDIPHSEIRRMESEGVYEEKFDKSNSSKDTTIYFQDEWNKTPTSENPDPAGFGKDEWDNLHHDIDGYEDKEHSLHLVDNFYKDVDIQDFEHDDEDTYIDGIDERPKKKPNVEEDDAWDY